MVAKGYSSVALVTEELGRADLPVAQQNQVDGLLTEAEATIDRLTGKAWLTASPVADELHALSGPVVYLERTPVASVTAVAVRSAAVGATWTALAAGTGYELLDPTTGILTLSGWGGGDVVVNTAWGGYDLVRVSYTHTDPLPVPADVRGVATRMVANRMRARLEPSLVGAKSVSVGQGDVAITYRDDTGYGPGLTEDDAAILKSYRGVVFA
jgi:hypothetical protein